MNISRLEEKFQKLIIPKLKKEFNLKQDLAVPRIKKVVINIGVGEICRDEGALKKANEYLTALSGQKPSTRKSKKSIAEFKTRIGSPVGLVVTLRGRRAFEFLDRLINIVLPRVRDFRGVKNTAFDDQGNYTLALTEQTIFPEVQYDKIDKTRGMEISIVSNANNKVKARRLLEEFGMPFAKEGQNG